MKFFENMRKNVQVVINRIIKFIENIPKKIKASIDRIDEKMLKSKFKGKIRKSLYTKLAQCLENGVSLSEGLGLLYEHATDDGKDLKTPAAVALKEWMKGISNGQSFSNCIIGWVPQEDLTVIAAGEVSSRLADALKNALLIQESTKAIKKTIILGLAYPTALILATIAFLLVFGLKVVPALAVVYPTDKWTGLGVALVIASQIVNTWFIPLVIAVFVLMIAITVSLPRFVGPIRAKLDQYPPYSLYRIMNGAGFLLSIAVLTKAGVQTTEVLRILQKNSTPWYSERITGALRHVSNGDNLGDALYKTKLGFPDVETVRDMRSYSRMSGMEDIFDKLAREWMVASVQRVKEQTNVMGGIALVVMAIVVGTLSMGITSITQQITSATSQGG
jgi:type II secretory pathway component PulF